MILGETMLNLESRSPQGVVVGIVLVAVMLGGGLMLIRLRRELEG